ncbi:MAG: hypothetical protein R3D57_05725 [Hyphomicrobiaceae bacterium]
MATLPVGIRLAAVAGLPDWLAAAYRAVALPDAFDELGLLLGNSPVDLGGLLALQGLERADIARIVASPALRTEAVNMMAGLSSVALSAEAMVLSGGDPRIALDPRTGMNGYGAAPRPVTGEISFASSTASSMTTTGFAAVETLRQHLIAEAVGGRLAAACTREANAIRTEIGRHLGLDQVPGADVILAASGTDTTFAALAIAKAADSTPITSLFLAPDETGSGIPHAAAGRHFLNATSLGHSVAAGQPSRAWAARRSTPNGSLFASLPARFAHRRRSMRRSRAKSPGSSLVGAGVCCMPSMRPRPGPAHQLPR